MKTTEHFKNTISAKLTEIALNDPLFAESLKKENKNIDDCITYILNTVKNSGCNGFCDVEIFGMAVHYYDESSIEIGKPINCQVVVNHAVELTQEEIEEAKNKAKEKVISTEMARMQKKPTVTKKPDPNTPQQLSLF